MPIDIEFAALLDELIAQRVLNIPIVRKLTSLLQGEHPSIHLGQGQEFYDVRPYDPSRDSLASIDVPLSRKLGRPVSRLFLEEKELQVYLVADISEAMTWGSRELPKTRLLVMAASLIGAAMLYHMNPLGSVCSGAMDSFRKPRHSRAELWNFFRNVQNYSGNRSREKVWQGMRDVAAAITQPSLIIFFSDFFVELQRVEEMLGWFGRHEFLPVLIHSPYEHRLPEVAESFSGLETPAEYSREVGAVPAKTKFHLLISEQEHGIVDCFFRKGIKQYMHVSDPRTMVEDVFCLLPTI